jgi:hypothetical protein
MKKERRDKETRMRKTGSRLLRVFPFMAEEKLGPGGKNRRAEKRTRGGEVDEKKGGAERIRPEAPIAPSKAARAGKALLGGKTWRKSPRFGLRGAVPTGFSNAGRRNFFRRLLKISGDSIATGGKKEKRKKRAGEGGGERGLVEGAMV